jgi:3-oxoacyl-[acyl-carrier protein] reductase
MSENPADPSAVRESNKGIFSARKAYLTPAHSIVTGGSRGIGACIAQDLASRGAKVTITYSSDRSRQPTNEIIKSIKEIGGEAISIQSDLKTLEAPKQIVDATVQAFGPHIDILVNNAAVISGKRIAEITPGDFDELFYTNARAPLFMVQAVLPNLRRPGRIINISSVGARSAFEGTGLYSASKAALEGFTRNWAAELGGDGTTVNAVNPGPVQSEMLDQVAEEIKDLQFKTTPLEHRAGRVDEIAEIVAFLAEPRSSWVTGQCISASGGYHLY